jgi:hypothetical protein
MTDTLTERMLGVLLQVTPNYVMTAVIKNRLQEGQIKAQRKKRKTRAEILAAMDLRCVIAIRKLACAYSHSLT